jgi:hypothetical protein
VLSPPLTDEQSSGSGGPGSRVVEGKFVRIDTDPICLISKAHTNSLPWCTALFILRYPLKWVLFFFWQYYGFEFEASPLLSKCSATWATPPFFFAFRSFFRYSLMLFALGQPLSVILLPLLPTTCDYQAWTTMSGLANFFFFLVLGWPQTMILLLFASQVSGITSMGHCAWTKIGALLTLFLKPTLDESFHLHELKMESSHSSWRSYWDCPFWGGKRIVDTVLLPLLILDFMPLKSHVLSFFLPLCLLQRHSSTIYFPFFSIIQLFK